MILAIIIALAVVGAVNAVAAIRAYGCESGGQPPQQPDGPACTSVFQTSYARLFGVPNGVVGLAYYLAAIGLAIGALGGAGGPLIEIGAMLAAAAAGFSIYLTYLLIFRLHMSCRICYTANAINVALAVLWGWLSLAGAQP